MKCPACGNELTEINIGGAIVDACVGHCGGAWFDWMELKKVDEPYEAEGEVLLNIKKDEKLVVDHSKKRKCPKCKDMIMMRHLHSTKREAEVDECPKCAGFWLDAGELDSIRNAFSSIKEKNKAGDAFINNYISNNFGEELDKMRAESQAKLVFAKKFAHTLRFLCPSYYIKGKQDGAAF